MIIKKMRALIPADLSAKQKALILAATKLFHRYGFSKVSVEELCRLAGVSKVTFYRYYKGKDELILAILELIFTDMIRQTNELLDSERSLKEKFDRVIVMKQEFMDILGEELMQGLFTHPAARDYYEKLSRESYAGFRAFLYREQERGGINPGLNIELFLTILQELSGMISKRSLAGNSKNFKELVAQVNEILIYGLINREPL
jgi:AcrR family transcriptional regulator